MKSHICKRSKRWLQPVRSDEVQSRIMEENVLCVGGKKYEQVVFVNEGIMEVLWEVVRGDISVDVYAADVFKE